MNSYTVVEIKGVKLRLFGTPEVGPAGWTRESVVELVRRQTDGIKCVCVHDVAGAGRVKTVTTVSRRAALELFQG